MMRKFVTFFAVMALGAACASVGDHMLPPGAAQGPFVQASCNASEVDTLVTTDTSGSNTVEVTQSVISTYAVIDADPWDVQVKILTQYPIGCDIYSWAGAPDCVETEGFDRSWNWFVTFPQGNGDGTSRIRCSTETTVTRVTYDAGMVEIDRTEDMATTVQVEEVWYR